MPNVEQNVQDVSTRLLQLFEKVFVYDVKYGDNVRELKAATQSYPTDVVNKVIQDLVANTDDPKHICELAAIYAFYDFNSATPYLLKLLTHPTSFVRTSAVCKLVQCRGTDLEPTAIEHLCAVLDHDNDGNTRAWAAAALGEIGNPISLSCLQKSVDTDTGIDIEGRSINEIAKNAIENVLSRRA